MCLKHIYVTNTLRKIFVVFFFFDEAICLYRLYNNTRLETKYFDYSLTKRNKPTLGVTFPYI